MMCLGAAQHILTLKALTYFHVNQETKEFFQFVIIFKWLSQHFPLNLNTYVIGLRPLKIFVLFQCGD